MKPPTELKARVLAAVASEASPDRQRVSRRATVAWLVAVATALVVFLMVGGIRAVERPVSFVLVTVAGWAAIALAATWACARRGSMVGRPLGVLLLATALTPAALGLWYLISAASWGCGGPPSAPSYALVCLSVSIALVAGPCAVMMRARWASDPAHPRATAAAVGVVAGAWAGVMMELHCERADVAHVALGHVAPALVLALLGALFGERLLGVHTQAARAPADPR